MDIFVVGLLVTLVFISGWTLCHVQEKRAYRIRACNLTTVEAHQAEGARLVQQAIRTRNPAFRQYLRDEAFRQYVLADQLENGPYWS